MKILCVLLVALLAIHVADSTRVRLARLKEKASTADVPASGSSVPSLPSTSMSSAAAGSGSGSMPTPESLMSSMSASMGSVGSVSSADSMGSMTTSESSSPVVPVSSQSASSTGDVAVSNEEAKEAINAAPLTPDSGSAVDSGSAAGSQGDSCHPQCNGATVVWDNSNGNGQQTNTGSSSSVSVDDALNPINQWIKDFKHRTDGEGGLFSAAQETVKPLISKLKRNQEMAVLKLEQSNDAILRHVEEAATDHVYAVLQQAEAEENHRADRRRKRFQLEDAKEDLAEKQAIKRALESESSSSSSSSDSDSDSDSDSESSHSESSHSSYSSSSSQSPSSSHSESSRSASSTGSESSKSHSSESSDD